MWQWSDNTTALFLDVMKSTSISSPYCAAFYKKSHKFKVIKCDTSKEADYLCEIPKKLDQQSQQQSVIELPAPAKTAFTLPDMRVCWNLETTKDFLGCKARSGIQDSPSTTTCSLYRQDPDIPWFQCRDNKGCAPYTLVCDHRQDCADGSDEDFCVFRPCDWSHFACHSMKQVSILHTGEVINFTFFCNHLHVLKSILLLLLFALLGFCLPFFFALRLLLLLPRDNYDS